MAVFRLWLARLVRRTPLQNLPRKADGEGDPRGIKANRRADRRGNRVRKTLLLLLNERDSVGRHRESDSEICCSEEMGMLLLPLKLPGCFYRKPLHKERRDL